MQSYIYIHIANSYETNKSQKRHHDYWNLAANSCHVVGQGRQHCENDSSRKFWLETKVDGKRVEDWATTYPFAIAVCLFALHITAFHDTLFHPLHHTLPHQLTDYQRSDTIWSAAATTTSLSSWWSVIHKCHRKRLWLPRQEGYAFKCVCLFVCQEDY